jgi:NAD(P)-dependent dehydrogenase (short-subunit alcohol dehydrogenase family)
MGMGELEGRVALVTGAAKGLGEATARALAAQGAKVTVTDLAAPEELAEQIGGIAAAQDVTSEDQWVATMALVRDRAGGLDILVNNAGVFLAKPITETTLEQWRFVQSVNVEGVFLGHKHAAPLLGERAMKWRGGAAIVNLSSVAGLRGAALCTAYNASKGAVRLLTKGAALELAPLKIRVNSVHPGIIETDMGQGLVDDFAAAAGAGGNETRDQLGRMHPLGDFGVPENVADAAVFLASDRAAFMTGSEVVVDGGLTAR